MKDQNHPFFKPLWRRIAILVVCLSWFAVEIYTGSPGWAIITLGFLAYAIYHFFIIYKPIDENAPTDPASDTKE